MNIAIKRRRRRRNIEERGSLIPVAWVPEWMLGKPLVEWLISQLPPEESAPMLERLRERLKERENGGKTSFA